MIAKFQGCLDAQSLLKGVITELILSYLQLTWLLSLKCFTIKQVLIEMEFKKLFF